MTVNARPIPILLMVRELDMGGCERDLTKVAIGLDRSLFTPFAGCFHPNGMRAAELRAAKVPIVQFPVTSFASRSTLKVARQFGQFVADNKIQIVHSFDVPTNIFTVPSARHYKVPVVIASHFWLMDLIPPVHRNMHRMVDLLAHRIVVNSAAVGRSLEGVASSKIYLSHNGVDTRSFFPAPAKDLPEFLQGSLVIGTLCVLRSEKRLDLLIDAFERIHNNRPDAKLLIVGSGAMLPLLQERCRALGIEKFCMFEPAVADAANWMRMVDVFVLTSESESFPNAVLEAMACGRCVVASDVGGVSELVKDGVNGLTFPAKDLDALTERLQRVVDDSALRGKLAAEAVRTAREEFNIELAVKRLQDLYLSMAAKVKGR